jgi:hypothetical protein
MTTQVIRIYGSAANAAKATQHLSKAGFEDVAQFSGGKSKGAPARTKLRDDLMKFHIWKSHAEVYADRLMKGEELVAVHAPFGTALKVGKIMDMYDPVDPGLALHENTRDYWWDDAAPLSSSLQLPILARSALFFETIAGISSLTRGSAFMSDVLGMPLLSTGSASKHSSWGLPLLSRSATPLSSSIGMKTLSESATPLSSMLGLRVLSRR